MNFGNKLENEINTTINKYISNNYYRNGNRILQKRINHHYEINIERLVYRI